MENTNEQRELPDLLEPKVEIGPIDHYKPSFFKNSSLFQRVKVGFVKEKEKKNFSKVENIFEVKEFSWR
jgi:hypothetical protein